MRTWSRALVVGLMLGALGATSAEAQRRPGRRGGDMQAREQLMERIRARFGQMISDELDLNEDDADRLGEVVGTFDQDRARLAREEQAVRRRVEALMLEGGDDEEEARTLLARMAELRADEARLFVAEQERLLEVLNPVQVLRFMTLREQMAQRIRALRGGGPGGPRRLGGPGLPGGPTGGRSGG